jgi:hypothetical protein
MRTVIGIFKGFTRCDNTMLDVYIYRWIMLQSNKYKILTILYDFIYFTSAAKINMIYM